LRDTANANAFAWTLAQSEIHLCCTATAVRHVLKANAFTTQSEEPSITKAMRAKQNLILLSAGFFCTGSKQISTRKFAWKRKRLGIQRMDTPSNRKSLRRRLSRPERRSIHIRIPQRKTKTNTNNKNKILKKQLNSQKTTEYSKKHSNKNKKILEMKTNQFTKTGFSGTLL
jgi:hypothetical protein